MDVAETHIRNLLSQMAVEVDTVMCNSVCKERFHKDYALSGLSNRLTFPGTTAAIVDVYAHQHGRALRKRLLEQYTLSPADLKVAVTEYLLWMLVKSHAAPLPSVLPKLHHWLPMCYTKRFASRVMTSKRAAIIQQVDFNADGSVAATKGVRDTFFAHDKCEDGYYPARIEQFFGRIESAYSALTLRRTEKTAWTEVVSFAFFLVQSVRNPDPKGHYFSKDHCDRIIPNLFAAIDDYDQPYIQFARDCENLWFSPFFPPRIRKTVTGVTAAVFPMTPQTAMVITDAEIADAEAHRIATANAEAMVRHAVRTGKPLYGIVPDED